MTATAHARLAGLMVAVCAAYYLASQVGLALRIPPATTSVMWPANTVLTMALLLSPPRRWAWWLAAALPAHVLVQATTGWPAPMIVILFGTNSLEALIAAVGFRRVAGPSLRVDTLRHAGALMLIAGIVAPVMSSFPDAAIVSWFQGEPFGAVMRRRMAANVLTTLTLLPALAALVVHAPTWARRASRARAIEAGALVAALLVGMTAAIAIGFWRYGAPGAGAMAMLIVLPVLLWAALRFGTAGASLALLGTAGVTISTTIASVRTSEIETAEQAVFTLQILLIMLTLPLLGCAALVEERYRAKLALIESLAFEAMLAKLSATFVGVPVGRMREAFAAATEQLGKFLALDAVVLLEHGAATGAAPMAALWPAGSPVAQRAAAAPHDLWPQALRDVHRGREALVGADAVSPTVGAPDTRDPRLERVLALPVRRGPRLVGTLLLVGGSRPGPWPAKYLDGVRLAADVLGQALDQWRGDEALRESESIKAAILAAIPMGVAVLARDGRIVSVNAQWDAAARERGLVILAGSATGGFLDVCRAAQLAGLPAAEDARDGVAAVLAGRRPRYVLDYCAVPSALDRWFTLSAVPLPGTDGGAVLTHAEITERRRAELSAQRSRDELAHVTRVSAMGELASSLAQRLHQPLSGIVRGAEAARRLLAQGEPDLPALDGLLRQIVEDDRRAGDVIEQLRDLLRKTASTRTPVDVNAIVREVTAMIEADAALRQVELEISLAPTPLVIAADRAQIAQVLLNLVLNAMEAMADTDAGSRRLRLRTEGGYEAAVVMVGDSGPGIDNDETLFEPFFTTKPSRTGMGLPIARTIVEAHGGRVWGASIPGGRGASFFVSLPLSET